jgi:transposase
VWLKQKWADLFHADFDVLLYDLTSTYFEGEMELNPKAKRGYSRDGRPDCLQVVIALVITTDGFPLAYEVMDGNTSDRATLRGFLDKIEHTYGKAKRMWVMDRGIPTEEILAEMRDSARPVSYLVGTPKSKIQQYEQKWLDLPWKKVRDSVDVKLFEDGGELYVLAKSTGRQAKETAMRRKRLARLLRKLRAMRPQFAFTRSTAHADRRRQNRSGPRIRFRPHRRARCRTGRDAAILSISRRQTQTERCPVARRSLLATFQSYGRGSRTALDSLCAIDANRIGIPIAQK